MYEHLKDLMIFTSICWDKLYLVFLWFTGVLNPFLFIKCKGITPLVRNILECGLPRVSESLVGCLLYLLDKPETRAAARLDLQCFAEPYCDFYFRKGNATMTDKAK